MDLNNVARRLRGDVVQAYQYDFQTKEQLVAFLKMLWENDVNMDWSYLVNNSIYVMTNKPISGNGIIPIWVVRIQTHNVSGSFLSQISRLTKVEMSHLAGASHDEKGKKILLFE